jgi:large subunit ribosomal protein L17
MIKNMIKSLIDNERVITTVPKAKTVKPLAEKIITLARTNSLANIRRVEKLLGNKELQVEFLDESGNANAGVQNVIQKLFKDVGPRNKDRNGGYCRIVRLAKRRLGDGGERCILELVEGGPTEVLTNAPKREATASAPAGGAPEPVGA